MYITIYYAGPMLDPFLRYDPWYGLDYARANLIFEFQINIFAV